ncbi:hypothetical protein [Thermophilibacter sp.]
MRLLTRDISAGAADPAVAHLLADLAEACAVYERVYGAGADGDAAVLGLATGAEMGALPELPPGARVYAVCVTDGTDPAPALDALGELARRCAAAGLAWRGGLAVIDADVVARAVRCPRMGWRRRRVSEAIDRLVAAIRAGADFPTEAVDPSRYARLMARRTPRP